MGIGSSQEQITTLHREGLGSCCYKEPDLVVTAMGNILHVCSTRVHPVAQSFLNDKQPCSTEITQVTRDSKIVSLVRYL